MKLSDQHHCQLCNKLLVDPWYVLSIVTGERVAPPGKPVTAGPNAYGVTRSIHICMICVGESQIGRVLLKSGWEVER